MGQIAVVVVALFMRFNASSKKDMELFLRRVYFLMFRMLFNDFLYSLVQPGNDSNLLVMIYRQIVSDNFVM